MNDQVQLKQVSDVQWEIPKSGNMKVPAMIIASKRLLDDMRQDRCLLQARNMATMHGAVDHVVVLSDAHQGYGFPIGGVAAFPAQGGIISPGGVGYDINCGVRMLATDIPVESFMKKKSAVLHEFRRSVPSGVGRGGAPLKREELVDVLRRGSEWAVDRGMGNADDLARTEEGGRMQNAKPEAVSDRAFKRGLPQLGTLGAGNHFVEVQRIDSVSNEDVARTLGLDQRNVTVMIHCGSRGLGHQIASDYIKLMEGKSDLSKLPDRELVNMPIDSTEGASYLGAMNCAVNFAFCNRQTIMHRVREALRGFFPDADVQLVYDVCHNIAKIEEHVVRGMPTQLCVHRKGATRSFGPGRKEVPEVYRSVGQPIIIPGSMGTASYVLVGTRKAEELTFGSTAHGAGRVESRTAARRKYRGERIQAELSSAGIEVAANGWKSLVEEAPQVYKDIDEVVRVSHEAGIGEIVARMKPIVVMKG